MITSRRNETLKAIRRLRRRQGDQALLEGPHLVEEALASAVPLTSVLITPSYAARPQSRAILERLARPALEVDENLLLELADADSPRGILAVAELPRLRCAELPVVEDGTYLLLDGIQEPGNLGAIARVAEAFGASALVLATGCVHPNHPRAMRASAGSLLRLPVARGVGAKELTDHLRSLRPTWAGLSAHGGSPLPRSRPERALVLAVGAEAGGLSPEVAARVDQLWTIEMQCRAESLNVAVATGIALYALQRRPLPAS